ncbi:MAG: hypothetical protein LBS91_01425 [Clostridiales Family XIII bacterium]|nr:hypothetical protein [Clostridiales Family XIII bacterium]
MKFSLNIRLVFLILSMVSVILGGTMLIGLAVSLVYREPGMTRIFLTLLIVFVAAGLAGMRLSRHNLKAQAIKIREGILAVTLCWVFAAALGALPYLLAGSHHSFIDAFFESTACITTTGSTLIENLADLPKSLLFWRQFTNWIGGLGIIIFAITIIPMLGFGAANLASAETTGQTVERIRSRMSDMARGISILFVVLTGAEIMLLLAGGTGLYDAFVLSFGSLGNGGFANYHADLLSEDSMYIEAVIAIFCIVASMSFVSYQLLLKRRVGDFFKETEIRMFLGMAAVFAVLIFFILAVSKTYDSAAEAARHGVFQTLSFITTAGYKSADFDAWPRVTHWLLLIVMVVGGCSGSTSGGVKVVRAAVALSLIRRNIYKRLHPNAVVAVKLGDKAVPADRVSSIATFMILYVLVTLFSCVVLSLENLDAETTLGTVVAMLSNTGLVIGPGLGYGDAFTVFSQFSRVYMSLLMIAGRLELFTIVLLFSPAFWRPYR